MRLPRRSIFSEEKQKVEQTLTFIANTFRGLQNFRLQKLVLQIEGRGNSLVVQWLGLCAFTFGVQVQILVGELRSRKLCSIARKKKKNEGRGVANLTLSSLHGHTKRTIYKETIDGKS